MRLGIDHEPALLEAEVAPRDPARLAHERVRAVRADDPAGADGTPLATERQHTGAVIDPTRGHLGTVVRLGEPLGHPPPVHRDPGVGTADPIEGSLEFRLEEHVGALPARGSEAASIEPQQGLPVGPVPR